MDTFFAMDIQRAAIQSAESLYIIATSKNIETIKGRYSFLLTAAEMPQGQFVPLNPILSVLDTLKKGQSNPQYSTYIQMAIDQYKTIHPNAVLQDYQLAVLSNPNTFNVNEFYCSSLVNAIKRFCEKESEEIDALKKEAAKTKRISKIVDTIKSTQTELETKCSSASSYLSALAEFKKLAATFGTSL
jgi:hypothetical protein